MKPVTVTVDDFLAMDQSDKESIRAWLTANKVDPQLTLNFVWTEGGLHALTAIRDEDGKIQWNEAKQGPQTRVLFRPVPLAGYVPGVVADKGRDT